jgi:PAS domain-containing protein
MVRVREPQTDAVGPDWTRRPDPNPAVASAYPSIRFLAATGHGKLFGAVWWPHGLGSTRRRPGRKRLRRRRQPPARPCGHRLSAVRDSGRRPWHSAAMERLVGIADRTRAWPLWARLGAVALLLLTALAARFALAGAEPGYPYLTFFGAVLLAAALFGRWVGLLGTAAATALALWFFVPPVGSLRVEDPRDAWAALAFAATGLAFVLLATAARRAIRERDNASAALRLVLEAIGEPFYVLDAHWRFVHASRAALQAWGKAAPEVLERRYLDVLPEAAGAPILAAHEEAMRSRRPARLEALSPVLGRWVELDIHPAPGGGLSVAFRDIHARRLAEERQRLLVAELTHRIKNTLALVLAVADQTRRTVSSPDAFHAVFRDRLAALARAHDALRRDGGTGTTLEAVAREALGALHRRRRGRAAPGGGRPGGAPVLRRGGGARDGVPRACDQRGQARRAVGGFRAGAAVLGPGGGGCGRRPLARRAVGGGRGAAAARTSAQTRVRNAAARTRPRRADRRRDFARFRPLRPALPHPGTGRGRPRRRAPHRTHNGPRYRQRSGWSGSHVAAGQGRGARRLLLPTVKDAPCGTCGRSS